MNRIQMAGTALAIGGIIGTVVSGGFTATERGKKNGIQFGEIAPMAGLSVAAATAGVAMLVSKNKSNAETGALFLGAAALFGGIGLGYSAMNTHPMS